MTLRTWPVDPLEKVFRDDDPPDRGDGARVDAVRNEHATVQVAVRASEAVEGVTASTSALSNGDEEIGGEAVTTRLVGHVPVERNSPDTPEEELVREAPAEFPDPLLPRTEFDLDAGETRSVWVTVETPTGLPAGTYEGTVTITAGGERATEEIAVRVHPVDLPDERHLWLQNSVRSGKIADHHGVERWSDEFWDLLGAYAENLAAHRSNVVNASLYGFVQIIEEADGDLSFDFSRLDRYIGVFEEAGVLGRVSAGHLARRPPKTYLDDEDAQDEWWAAREFESYPVAVHRPDGELAYVQDAMKTSDPAFEEFLSQFLPALEDHLAERGWLDEFTLKIADEAVDANAASYNRIGELVREYSPQIKTSNATQTHEVAESIDVWIPLLDEYGEDQAFYEERKEEGDEVWHYTCLEPAGRYPNRFVDYSLTKVRILQWVNFRYDLAGFLHWGYNAWTDEPFQDVENEPNHPMPLPPGDPFIVYPGDGGPIDSIRWEATRDAAEDYELLRLAAEVDEERARAICERAVESPTEYVRDPAVFRDIRTELIELAAADPTQ